jgi:hypothetical protein
VGRYAEGLAAKFLDSKEYDGGNMAEQIRRSMIESMTELINKAVEKAFEDRKD